MNTPHQTGQSRSHKRKQTGQALVEFSLILPILLFLLLGIIDYGRILLVFSNASSSVRNAARQGTLVGEIPDPDRGGAVVPRYMACAVITDFASDVFGATINSVDVLYFNTEGLTSGERATLSTNLAALDPTVPATLTTANFDCTVAASPDRISEGDIETGDLMVILLSTRVDFITPLLSSVFPSFELSFRAQRTLVEALVLNVEGDDLDGDGLLDEWEFVRFGCILENTDELNNPVYLIPDGTLAMRVGASWAFVTSPYDNTAPAPEPVAQSPAPGTPNNSDGYTIFVGGSLAGGDCARDNISLTLFDDPSQYDYLDCATAVSTPPDSDPADDLLENCVLVGTGLFSSTSDPDGDGCNNGCEEARFTNPYDYLGGFPGEDTDNDGLSDAAEIGGGSNPLIADTDGDGLLDGEERCETVNSVDPTICDSSLSGIWTDTNPLFVDSDNDGLEDGDEYFGGVTDPAIGDTDGDGLNDGFEVNGFQLTLNIDGLVFTLPGLVYTDAGVGGGDTDGDGISDGDEVNGHYITNDIDGTNILVYTHPADEDTDDDGVCDGPLAGISGTCPLTKDINPTRTDTDGDGLTDYQEQITYSTLADNVNSDGDTCGLDDGFEMLGTQAIVSYPGHTDYDYNGINGVNAMDLESDGDGILDCVEVNTYGSNPYTDDSDGDGYTDDVEIDPANWCLEIMRDDSAVTLPCGGAGGGTDADNGGTGDGFIDAWEVAYFGTDTNDLSDPTTVAALDDNDDCDLTCEYARRTDPTKFDTDNDGIRDGWETGSNPLIADTDGDTLIDGRESSASCVDLVALQIVNPAYTDADCYGTNPLLLDTDLDGLTDGAEVNGGLSVTINGVATPVTSDPTDPDTDNDGLSDGEEVNGVTFSVTINGDSVTYAPVTVPSNPNSTDSDGDGVHDFLESKIFRTFANDDDTDGDGLLDGSTVSTIGEYPNSFDGSLVYYDTDPHKNDTDNDGLSDLQEVTGFNISITTYDAGGTPTTVNPTAIAGYDPATPFSTTNLSPLIADTDGDGISDGDEVNLSVVTNPTLANTDGDVDAGGNPILDGADNCPLHDNSDQQDLDMDGMGTVCDTDGEIATNIYVDPMTDASSLVDATNWTPSVIVKAVNDFGQGQAGVDITVEFTDPANGDALIGVAQVCTTAASGECTVDIGSQDQATLPDVVATVTALANPPVGLSHDAGQDDGPLAISVPPLSVHVETMVGSINSGNHLAWEAAVVVTVEDDFGAKVDGVQVEVTIVDSDGTTYVEFCTSAIVTGECTVYTGASSLNGTSATASITDIPNPLTYGYDATSNAAPEVIAAPPPPPAEHVVVSNINVDSSNNWSISFTVAVNDGTSNLNGRTVNFAYANYDFNTPSGTGTLSCITAGAGTCNISLGGLKTVGGGSEDNVRLTITSITGNLGTYDATADVVTFTNPVTGGGTVSNVIIGSPSTAFRLNN